MCLLISTLAAQTIAAPAPKVALGSNDTDLKYFLATNAQNCELIFCETLHLNDLRKALEKQRTTRIHFASFFEKPVYYLFRRTVDGFLIVRSTNKNDLLDENLLALAGSAHGTYSNVYWSIGNNNLVYDHAYLTQYSLKNQGATWQRLADESTHQVLTLGMWIQSESVKWKGDEFTANTLAGPPVPADKRNQRIASGSISESPGTPISLHCNIGANDLNIRVLGSKHFECGLTLPRLFDVVLSWPGGSQTNSYEIVSLKYDTVSDSDIDPDLIFKHNPRLSIITKDVDNKGFISQTAGQSIQHPMRIVFSNEKPTKPYRSFIVIGVMVSLTVLFLLLAINRKRRLPRAITRK